MVGSFADAFGPAARRFFRPIRVVGLGGGSYLGLSFCELLESREKLEYSRLLRAYDKDSRDQPLSLCCLCYPLLAGFRQDWTGWSPFK
jgi:hypothetical protein